jgi:hypothetical protein
MALNLSKDIIFDRYGDICFNYGDILTTESYSDIIYQNVMTRLITNFGDYKNEASFGANVSSLVGKPANATSELSIKNKIIYVLTYDSFLQASEVNVLTLSQGDRIFARINIFINQGTTLITDKITINSIFNAASGSLYGSAT